MGRCLVILYVQKFMLLTINQRVCVCVFWGSHKHRVDSSGLQRWRQTALYCSSPQLLILVRQEQSVLLLVNYVPSCRLQFQLYFSTPAYNFQIILNTLISWLRYVLLGLVLNSAGWQVTKRSFTTVVDLLILDIS